MRGISVNKPNVTSSGIKLECAHIFAEFALILIYAHSVPNVFARRAEITVQEKYRIPSAAFSKSP